MKIRGKAEGVVDDINRRVDQLIVERDRLRAWLRQVLELKANGAPSTEVMLALEEVGDAGGWALVESPALVALPVLTTGCACCGDVVDVEPTLCEQCASTFTRYADGTAFCDHHEPGGST